MAVLTGIDVLGIQRYVFASNRLRDVLSASWMVDHVMRRESDSLLQWGMTDDRVLVAAGGNAVLDFGDLAAARAWTAKYTRWLHDKAPGIEVVVCHRPYNENFLASKLKALAVDLARAKTERCPSAPQLGLSVTASCSVTGLPATELDHHDGDPLCRTIAMLRDPNIQEQAKDRWREYLPPQRKFPDEFDRMGRTVGDTSLIGVVHIDGNDVGQAVVHWLDQCIEKRTEPVRVRSEYREWSQAIDELGRGALKAVIQRVHSQVNPKDEHHVLLGTPHHLNFFLRDEGDSVLLPLRPILLGGDDLTFVCDGRIALDLAVAALREFESRTIPHLGPTRLTACAGVALVKAHAPFHRSYALAEDLCASAKRARRLENEKLGASITSWLDWHVGSTRPDETVDQVRTRDYQSGNLTMRPYPLVKFKDRDQSWEWLDTKLLGPGANVAMAEQGFRGSKFWAKSRSRVKRLGGLVTAGGGGIGRQIDSWNAIEEGIQLPAGLPQNGFFANRTPLLDAIELLDLHLRLQPDPGGDWHPVSTREEPK